ALFAARLLPMQKRLLDNKKNYYRVKAPRTRVLVGVLFNATKFMRSSTNNNCANLDRARAQRGVYLDSLNSKLPQDINIQSIRLKYIYDCTMFAQTG
ncbi:hypothetical protein GN958_ATG14408, partial [Phytophthora infestans]